MGKALFIQLGTVSLCLFVIVSCTKPTAPASPVNISALNDSERASLQKWLSRHPGYRVSTEADCDCDEDIHRTRKSGTWGEPIPNYEPFVLTGDFNKDGQSDFAILTTANSPGRPLLLIFNGPFRATIKDPAYIRKLELTDTKHIGLFLSYEDRLPLVGPFESEGCLYRPNGATYAEDCGSD